MTLEHHNLTVSWDMFLRFELWSNVIQTALDLKKFVLYSVATIKHIILLLIFSLCYIFPYHNLLMKKEKNFNFHYHKLLQKMELNNTASHWLWHLKLIYNINNLNAYSWRYSKEVLWIKKNKLSSSYNVGIYHIQHIIWLIYRL